MPSILKIVSVLVILWSSMGAAADPSAAGKSAVNDFIKPPGCAERAPSLEINQERKTLAMNSFCYSMAMAVCQYGATGCDAYGFNPAVKAKDPEFQPNFSGASKPEDITNGVKTWQDKIASAGRLAQACCGTGAGCPLEGPARVSFDKVTSANANPSAGAPGAPTGAKPGPSGAGKAGMNQTQGLQADTNAHGALAHGGIAGLCQGYRDICLERYALLQRKLQEAPCKSGACAAEVVQADEALKKGEEQCRGLSAQARMTQAVGTGEAGDIAEQDRERTRAGGENPGGGGSGSGSGSGSGDAAGGGGMNPMSMLSGLAQALAAQQQQPPMDPYANQQMQTPACNPALAGCATNANGTQAASTSGSGSGSRGTAETRGDGSSTGGYNVASSGGLSGAGIDVPGAGAGGGAGGTPVSTHQIPGGGGGGVPGGGSASLGGGGGGSGAALAPAGRVSDVLHGLSSPSGYSQTLAGMKMDPGAGGSGGNYDRAPASDYNGMRLADFLPGGKKDPARALAGQGAFNPQAQQINGKQVDIWRRISEHIRRRCAQGLLRDCGP